MLTESLKMTAQQEADQLLRDHQLTRLLKELELDIASVVTAHYNPQPTGFEFEFEFEFEPEPEPTIGIDLTIEDWGLLNDQPHFDRLLA